MRFTLVAALAIVLGSVAPARSHEIGTTQVVVTFTPEGEYVVSLSTDAASLLAKLETLAGQLRSRPVLFLDYQQRIDALRAQFLEQISVRFDGVAVTPDVTSVPEADVHAAFEAPGATLRLRGPIPAGARRFSWRYDLAFATYALVLPAANSSTSHTEWLEGGQESRPFPLDERATTPSRTAIAGTYFALGFTHILPKGLDHILFVLGLFLLSRRLRPMLVQVSAFTLAHTITLGLALYGVIGWAPSLVEPLIALSLVYVAVENLATRELKPWRVALVFAFGLLHGMGFAEVLRQQALPKERLATALLTLNAGVEAGQLAVIGAAFLLIAARSIDRAEYRRRIVVPGSVVIALTGLYWTAERLIT